MGSLRPVASECCVTQGVPTGLMFRSPFTELSVEPAQLQLLQHSRGNAPGDCHRARAVAEPSVMPFLRSPPDRRSCFHDVCTSNVGLWQHVILCQSSVNCSALQSNTAADNAGSLSTCQSSNHLTPHRLRGGLLVPWASQAAAGVTDQRRSCTGSPPAGHRHNEGGNRRGAPSNRMLVNR